MGYYTNKLEHQYLIEEKQYRSDTKNFISLISGIFMKKFKIVKIQSNLKNRFYNWIHLNLPIHVRKNGKNNLKLADGKCNPNSAIYYLLL